MKAKNQTSDVDTINEEGVENSEPLVPVKVVESKFAHLTKNINIYTEYALDIHVENDNTLSVAENNSSEVNSILKGIDKIRKEFKEPYFRTAKLIDEYAKTLTNPLEEAKKSINEAITNYKRVQEATARAQAEEVRKKAEALADAKAAEADRIDRIQRQLIARLYGGQWFNRENQRKTSAGCIHYRDCDELTKAVKERIPKIDEFEYMQDEYRKMKKDILKLISTHKSNLIELESDSKLLKENAQKSIDQAKEAAGIAINEAKEEMTQNIIKEAKKEIKTSEAETKEAGKGVRKVLKFEMAEIEDVPKEFLMLDDTKVRAWASEHKDKIKQMLKDGRNVKNGIKFWLEDSYVSR